jgi:acyl-CoA synthetase (AMP-forming)/AMP-acid ligase II
MGDIGRVDEQGFVILLGRAKDMIISGGFNVYPRDLEDTLLSQPEVVDAAVIGVPSERRGKTQPISALKQLDELPRSHTGKILKTELRAMLDLAVG